MANTFKVVTKAGVTSADVIYTVAGENEMETTDTLTLTATGAADIALSIMEIT
jgi:hypothetical protein